MDNYSIFKKNNTLSQPSVLNKPPNFIKSKKKVLCWADSVLATTGFGIVSKHILKALYNTGKYEIDQLAINHFDIFHDKNVAPYNITPARLNDPKDPYGNQMFIDALQRKQYDIVFVINDTFVVEGVAKHINEIREIKEQNGGKPFYLVYYYPVDCCLLPQATTLTGVADRAVAYTNFAKASSEKVGINPTDVIYHGTDIKSFHPLSEQERKLARRKYLNVVDDDKFILINVNRNSLRKDMARTLLAFHEFRKKVPNSLLYMHCKIEDGAGGHPVDLKVPLQELNFDITKDVIFPRNFSAAKGFPVHVINELYNCADAYISTNLGEGWGISGCEAMAAGVPVIIPDNTSAPEIYGDGRGYLVDCKEKIFVDNSGYRKWARMEDIQEQMMRCYNDWKEDNQNRKDIIRKARDFVHQYSWDNVCKDWIKLFDELELKPPKGKSRLEGESI